MRSLKRPTNDRSDLAQLIVSFRSSFRRYICTPPLLVPEDQIGASKRPPLSRKLCVRSLSARSFAYFLSRRLSGPIRRVNPSRLPCNKDLLNNDSSYLIVLLSSTLRPSSIHSKTAKNLLTGMSTKKAYIQYSYTICSFKHSQE